MVPTPTLVWLLVLGAPVWLVWLLFPAGWVAAAVCLAALGVLSMRDYFWVPADGALEIDRQVGRLSLGAVVPVQVRFVNRSRRPIRVSMRDELPEGLELVTPLAPLDVPARAQRESAYEVRCVRRGRFRLEDTVVRLGRPGALVERQTRVAAPADVRVYPRFAPGDELRLLARINQQEDAARRPRHVRGEGTDFESLTRYEPGQDLRKIDWKGSARRGFLVSRNLQVERGQLVALLIDGGRLMAQRIGDYPRFEHALRAAVMLSYVAQKRGDAIAVSTFSDRVESFVPPTRGRAVMARVLDSLSTVQVRQVESDYWHVVGQVMHRLRRRSLLIVLTDVLDAQASSGLISNMVRAASRHLVLCVVLREPRISAIAEASPRDLHETYRTAAAAHLANSRQLALDTMRSRGILVLDAQPDRLTADLIGRYLEVRKANLQ